MNTTSMNVVVGMLNVCSHHYRLYFRFLVGDGGEGGVGCTAGTTQVTLTVTQCANSECTIGTESMRA